MTTEKLMQLALERAGMESIPSDSTISVPGENIKKLAFGIDMESWIVDRHVAPSGSTLVVGTAGNFVQSKRFGLLLDALALVESDVNIHLRIAGSGPLEQVLKSKASELPGSNIEVEFLGQVHDMRAFYDSCDLFTFPAKNESFVLVVLEALARGRPVIVGSDVGGCRELLQDRINGLVIESTTEAWAKSLTALYRVRTLLSSLQSGAEASDLSRYDIRSTRTALERLVNGKESGE